jgi:nucleolar protein 4
MDAQRFERRCFSQSFEILLFIKLFVELIMRKRPLSVTLAVTKGKVPQLLAEKDTTKKTPRDKRNLYLAKEGVIMPGTEAAAGLSKSDLQKRQKAEEEKKAKLKMPHFIVSKTR